MLIDFEIVQDSLKSANHNI